MYSELTEMAQPTVRIVESVTMKAFLTMLIAIIVIKRAKKKNEMATPKGHIFSFPFSTDPSN